ncbi:MAG: cupin domain-containing protein [Thermodesulfovibrionales bacterium]|nr:cupin domain-containing protein [Thermodesulfovibrionales bacterium]
MSSTAKTKLEKSLCEWNGTIQKKGSPNNSRILRFKEGFRWSSVKTEKYKEGDRESWSSVVRMVLIGNRGESTKFSLRYFEISPKGYSSLERHRHEHVIVCIRGKGQIVINKRKFRIGYLDTVYISPDTIHQLVNPYDEPFGFFCIVDSKRDRPVVLS